MANINTLLETYRLTVEVDDQASEPVARLNESLSEVAGTARVASDGVKQFGASASESADGLTRIGSSVSAFSKISQQIDPASRAMAVLAREQQRYNMAMQAGQRALADGLTTLDSFNRTMDVQRVKVNQAEKAVEQALNAYNKLGASAEYIQGKFSSANEASSQAATGLTHMAEGARNTRYQYMILTDEVHKFLDQVIAGGNPFQAAFIRCPMPLRSLVSWGGLALLQSRLAQPF